MEKYIFDTNIFNDIFDGSFDIRQLSELELYVTHIQFDELMKTPDIDRRNSLLLVLQKLSPVNELTESTVLDAPRLNYVKLGNAIDYKEILHRLDQRKKKPNNVMDALIGETAHKNGLTLVTNDDNFYSVMKGFGCSVIKLDELIRQIS